MGGAFKQLPKSDAEKQFAQNLATLQAASRNEFRGDAVTAPAISQAREYYQQYGKQLGQLLELGNQLRAEYKSVETGATRTIADAPKNMEIGYAVGVGATVGTLGVVGKALLDCNLVGLTGQAAYEQVTGKKFEHATWSEVGEMFTGPREMAGRTMKAYEEVKTALDGYHSALSNTYFAYQGVLEAINSADPAGAERSMADLTTSLQALQNAKEKLVSKINTANELGALFRGLEGEADKFVAESAISIVTAVTASAAIGAAAKGISTAVSSLSSTAVSGEVSVVGQAAGAALVQAGRIERGIAQVARAGKSVEQLAGGTANTSFTTYDAASSMQSQQEYVSSVVSGQTINRQIAIQDGI